MLTILITNPWNTLSFLRKRKDESTLLSVDLLYHCRPQYEQPNKRYYPLSRGQGIERQYFYGTDRTASPPIKHQHAGCMVMFHFVKRNFPKLVWKIVLFRNGYWNHGINTISKHFFLKPAYITHNATMPPTVQLDMCAMSMPWGRGSGFELRSGNWHWLKGHQLRTCIRLHKTPSGGTKRLYSVSHTLIHLWQLATISTLAATYFIFYFWSCVPLPLTQDSTSISR